MKTWKVYFILAAVCLSGLFFAPDIKSNPDPHKCEYKKCPMAGDYVFDGCGECEEGTDCYCLDKIHFDHPKWTYDQCEEYLFGETKPH